jgi:outer membrane protein OmpA-like peptidoglycan-associated protein/tetratricopeptide (TPR) repeat protein
MYKNIYFGLLILLTSLQSQAQSAREILKTGERQYKDKEYAQALATFRSGVETYPRDAKLNFYTGLTYLSMPDKKESLRYLQTAFTLDPHVDPHLYYYLGLSYQSNRLFAKAQEFFEEYKQANKKMADLVDKKIRQSQFADSLTRIPTNVVIENVGKTINSSFHEYSPLVSMDGNTMIFTSNRPDSTLDPGAPAGFEDIYISKKVNGQWSMPQKISPNINITFNDAAASLSPDGNTLILYYEYGGGDIYVSKRDGENWSKPIPLNENINTPYFWETSAFLTDDGRQLYFTSNRPGGMGNLDIYVSEMEETGDWGAAKNLGPVINTEGREDSPAFDPDGPTLYFSSDGHPNMGGTDIFKSDFKDGEWQKPVNLGYPINSVEDDSFFMISRDKKRAYFSTLREEGHAEIYTLTFVEPDMNLASVIGSPEPEVEPAPDQPSLIAGTLKPDVSSDDLSASRPSVSSTRDISERNMPTTQPSPYGEPEDFSRVFLFFAIGKDDLSDEAMIKLMNLSSNMKQSPEMHVLIEGHTDNTGSDLLNQALSVKRANTTAKFMTQMGIEPSRLSVRAYGATRPLVSNDDEREGREINRRIEISPAPTQAASGGIIAAK